MSRRAKSTERLSSTSYGTTSSSNVPTRSRRTYSSTSREYDASPALRSSGETASCSSFIERRRPAGNEMSSRRYFDSVATNLPIRRRARPNEPHRPPTPLPPHMLTDRESEEGSEESEASEEESLEENDYRSHNSQGSFTDQTEPERNTSGSPFSRRFPNQTKLEISLSGSQFSQRTTVQAENYPVTSFRPPSSTVVDRESQASRPRPPDPKPSSSGNVPKPAHLPSFHHSSCDSMLKNVYSEGAAVANPAYSFRSLAATSVNNQLQGRTPESETLSSASDLGSVVSHRNSVNVPAVSDSYIDRNNYVTKPRWNLTCNEINHVTSDNEPSRQPSSNPPVSKLESSCTSKTNASAAHTRQSYSTETTTTPSRQTGSTQVSHLGDDLFPDGSINRNKSMSRIIETTLGDQMASLSMEKVFNDPSFHGIYEEYSKNKNQPPRPYSSAPCVNSETKPENNAAETEESENAGQQTESPFVKAAREQIPDQLAILDQEILALLTTEVLKKNPILQKLQDASFRIRADKSLECLSVIDLGLEKKDHQFLTETWAELTKLTATCRMIYSLIYASGCQSMTFIKHIMSFMSQAINQGVDLAASLIRTATFIVSRDGSPGDLLKSVHDVRQLTDSLRNNYDFLETIREVLTENFTAIPLVAGDVLVDSKHGQPQDARSKKIKCASHAEHT